MQPLSSTSSPHGTPPPSPETLPSSTNSKDKNEHARTIQQSEPVIISQTGQEINRYTEAMADLPDIREERILAIQTALENGTYSVSAQDLADKIIPEISNTPHDQSHL